MRSDEHVNDFLPAYALDCLDADELDQVSNHLATCPVCRAELRAYQSLADALPLGVRQVEPAARVKAQLMERVQAQAETKNGGREKRPASWGQRLAAALRQVSPVWGLASLALIVILAASNFLLWRQVRSLGSAQPALQVVNLMETEAAPGATGIIVISKDGMHGTLVVDRLPILSEAQQYQLWLVRDGQRTSGGVFSVSRDGYGSVWVSAPDPLISYTRFGITVEPHGGSPGPTGERVLAGVN